jgi:hypothetical protein
LTGALWLAVVARYRLLAERSEFVSPDPLVAEVRAIREAYAKQFDYDLEAISRDLKEQEIRSGRKTVSLASRRAVPVDQMADREK